MEKEPAIAVPTRQVARAGISKTAKPAKKKASRTDFERKEIERIEELLPARAEQRGAAEDGKISEAARPVEKPQGDVAVPPLRWETFPSEYGENGVTLMTVNPYKVFVFWEVRKETLSIFKGDLTLRLYDVTGIDFDTTEAHSFHDIPVRERIGKDYILVSPGKEYIADIGILMDGIYVGIARSERISTPWIGVAGMEEFLSGVPETGVRIGY